MLDLLRRWVSWPQEPKRGRPELFAELLEPGVMMLMARDDLGAEEAIDMAIELLPHEKYNFNRAETRGILLRKML